MKTKTKKDCFALNEYGRCTALRVKKCEGCNFYKTKERFDKELKLIEKTK